MPRLSFEDVAELLGTRAIPGNEREIAALCTRLGELLALNGEAWIRAHREMLLEQWHKVVAGRLIP